ncbi:hypothetical protein [Rhodopseudomonas telluris]|uniref:Uncharacterized protein n=1 Tax=Rhodopseudomonas telluris TaxID=644215 RepID=A0ABV6EZB9_9BRAD
MDQKRYHAQRWRPDLDEFLLHSTHQSINRLRWVHRQLAEKAGAEHDYDRLSYEEISPHEENAPNDWIAIEVPALRSTLNALRDLVKRIAEDRLTERSVRSYGELKVFAGRTSILRGYVDRFRSEPIIETADPFVLQMIMKLPNNDQILRENGAHFGIHYHYLNHNKKRSETVLCFKDEDKFPLYHEPHAVKKAKFLARPERWQEEKRRSVYSVLEPELSAFAITEFRQPRSKASIVWKKGAATIADL